MTTGRAVLGAAARIAYTEANFALTADQTLTECTSPATPTARLYLETNYLMSRCTGRTSNAVDIIRLKPTSLEIAIPSLAFVEALFAFKSLRDQKSTLVHPFGEIIADIGRDRSTNTNVLVRALTDAQDSMAMFIQECEERLVKARVDVAMHSRVFDCSLGALLRMDRVIEEPLDDIVLAAVVEDATANALPNMAFLSEDGGFRQPAVVARLAAAHVSFMSSVGDAIAWYATV